VLLAGDRGGFRGRGSTPIVNDNPCKKTGPAGVGASCTGGPGRVTGKHVPAQREMGSHVEPKVSPTLLIKHDAAGQQRSNPGYLHRRVRYVRQSVPPRTDDRGEDPRLPAGRFSFNVKGRPVRLCSGGRHDSRLRSRIGSFLPDWVVGHGRGCLVATAPVVQKPPDTDARDHTRAKRASGARGAGTWTN